ncbi:peroxisomal membrane protein PEX13-like isoform X2 [Macrobrachium nipponense]|uniref:peroxisomal membrane protein PEX13-like isoform X2 n=1 Tax=Macrobrachium nipponense TaxID=159736 RepID=UPI0030C8AE57
MAAPPKPWERGTNVILNQRQSSFHPDLGFSSQNTGGGGTAQYDSRPPLPPRPTTYSSNSTLSRPYYSNYNSYSPFSSYGGSMFGGYGSYGGYGQYGSMGSSLPDENRFIQVAEDSSRQAFQSIESIVHAFGSVSMMLESTYHAVYSSFRAVLGVAEHFSRMKSHFAQIFSALAVVRTLKWIMKKLLYIIGLRSQDPSLEAAWRSTATTAATSLTEADLKQSRSSWPIVMFLAVVFGGPYLIWHLLSSLVPSGASQGSQKWHKGYSDHYAAVSLYSFQAASKKELSIQTGQNLFLAPKDLQPQVRGWLLASNGKEMGLVPANYLKILGLRKGSSHQANAPSMTGSRVAPGIPSMPVLKQSKQQLPSLSVAENSDPALMNQSPSGGPAPNSRRSEIRKKSLLDIGIPEQHLPLLQKMGSPETPQNMGGPGRSTVSGQQVEGSGALPNFVTGKPDVSGERGQEETVESRSTPVMGEEIKGKDILLDIEAAELDKRSDASANRGMPNGSFSTKSQLVHASDTMEQDISVLVGVEETGECISTDKAGGNDESLDEKGENSGNE